MIKSSAKVCKHLTVAEQSHSVHRRTAQGKCLNCDCKMVRQFLPLPGYPKLPWWEGIWGPWEEQA